MKSSSCHMELEERSPLVQDEVEWNALEHEARLVLQGNHRAGL